MQTLCHEVSDEQVIGGEVFDGHTKLCGLGMSAHPAPGFQGSTQQSGRCRSLLVEQVTGRSTMVRSAAGACFALQK